MRQSAFAPQVIILYDRQLMKHLDKKRTMVMSEHGLLRRSRILIPVLFITLAALACSLGGGQQNATVTPGGTAAQTQVAQSDVPEVEIRSPQDNSDVILNTEVQVYVHATDRVGVTRIEMRVDNLIVDTAASPEANGTPTMD